MYTSKTRIALGRGTGESAPSCGATKTLLNDPTPNGETRHTQSIWDRYITMPVPQFLVAAGFGRTKLYDLLSSGELDSVVIGRRRLILMDSYRRLIERQRAPAIAGS